MLNTLSLYDRSPLWNWMVGDGDQIFDRAIPSVQLPYEFSEGEHGFLLTVDLPGVRKEDLKIEVEDRMLTVSGDRKRGDQASKLAFRFRLPVTGDAAKIEAALDNGVLEIAIPKAEAAKARTVEIQAGKTLSAKAIATP